MEKNEQKDLSVYKQKFEEDVASFREFEAMDYVKSLKNQGLEDEAIEVGKTFLEQRPDLTAYINQYGYALYNKYIKNLQEKENINEEMVLEIAKEILDVCKQERYSPYEATCNALIKYALSKTPVDYEMVLTYLNYLDPTLLSKDPFVQEGRKEGESKFERWYRLAVRSAYETKNYKKCVEMANQAMALNIKWHYRNAYWIRIYRAKANLALGNFEECEHEYLTLQSQFFDADYYRALYQIQAGQEKYREANVYLLYDVYISGYDKNQKSLYSLLLDAAKIAGHDKAVSLLEALIAKLNQEAGKEDTVDEAYANMDSGEIYDRMIDEVTRHLDLYVDRKTGKVVHYNEEKELGSISVGGQPSIFFRQADFIYDEEVRRYERVDFTEMKTYDRKKQTITSKAVLILENEEEDFNFGY